MKAHARTAALFATGRRSLQESETTGAAAVDGARAPRGLSDGGDGLSLLLFQAALPQLPLLLYAAILFAGGAVTIAAAQILSVYFLPICFAIGAAIPVGYVQRRAEQRAAEFAADYPAILLAAASSLKAGMTPLQGIERSARLLPKESLARLEIQQMLDRLHGGMPREETINRFGRQFRLPDIQLFRSALLLVLENGGRLAPTLQRLAAVSNGRAILIGSARVSTASMRLTANILLCVAPLLVFLLAARTENYFDTFINHPAANAIGSAGAVLIVTSYVVLRKMSNFKP